MLPRKIFNYFEMCGRIAQSKNDERSFLIGALAIRKDGCMVKALNGPSQFPMRTAHAEYRLSSKIDIGSIVYVARVRIGDGALAISRPCDSCLSALMSKGVSKIFYSITSDEYGVINLKNGIERVKKSNSPSVYGEIGALQ